MTRTRLLGQHEKGQNKYRKTRSWASEEAGKPGPWGAGCVQCFATAPDQAKVKVKVRVRVRVGIGLDQPFEPRAYGIYHKHSLSSLRRRA